MQFFIDTANLEEIKEVYEMGILSGVTTNPSLVAKEGVDFHQRLREITDLVKEESVSAEVLSLEYEKMVAEGKELAAIAPNITIKVPITSDGLKVVKTLSQMGIKTNVTLVFSVNQALLAARAGATYVSPFVGRLDDIGHDGLELTEKIAMVFEKHHLSTKIIAASIRHPQHVTEAALRGAHIATIPYKVIHQLLQHPLTNKGIDLFMSDWEKAQQK